jgi:predicted dehydrogenase
MNPSFSRRQFLKSTGASIALFNIVPSHVLGQNAPSNKIVMGAIGVGSQGSGNMGQFLGMKDVHVRACCDVNKKRTDTFKSRVDKQYSNQDCLVYKDFRELLDRPDIDAVMVATPDHWHAAIECYAATRGKDIYGEKPFSHNLRDGRAVVDALKANGRIFQAGSWQRSTSNFRKAVELVKNGRIGKVKRIEIGLPNGGRGSAPTPNAPIPEGLDWDFWVGPAPFRPYQGVFDWNWRWVLDWGGGQMMDWICHHCDIGLWAAGKDRIGPATITSGGMEFDDGKGIYDSPTSYRYTCTYEDGLDVVVANASQLEKGMGARWIGENGEWVWVSRGGQATSNPKIWEMQPEPGEFRLLPNGGHFREFIDAVKNRTMTLTPAEISHRITSVGHLGQVAMFTGRKLTWDYKTEQIIGDPIANAMLGRESRAPWKLEGKV